MRTCRAILVPVLAGLWMAVAAVPAQAAPTITEYTTGLSPNAAPQGIAAGPDGNAWFTLYAKGAVGRIAPDGTVTEHAAGITQGQTEAITQGPDGNMWFVESGGTGAIGRITPSGSVTEFTIGLTPFGQPKDIAAGSDGALWFTEKGDRIGRIDPATGFINEYAVGLTLNSQPHAIAAGPDGNLWFTQKGNPGSIGRITPAGVITEYSVGLTAGRQPDDIAAGPDGNLWFTEAGNPGSIGRITPDGVITEFSTGLSPNSKPTGIAAGADGNMWFTEEAGDRIGRITPEGTITEYSTGLTPGGKPVRIAAGGDGNMWFTENADPGRIGRITVPPGASTLAPSASDHRSATLRARVRPNSQETTYSFEWGTTTAYGNQTSSASAGSAAAEQTVDAAISGLNAQTSYHYRVVATNASGTTYGQDWTFTTAAVPSPPSSATGTASAVGTTSATLGGTVNPSGLPTTYRFEWGTDTSYGSESPLPAGEAGADANDHAVSTDLTGLRPATTYHYRLVATSSAGTSYGADRTFTTSAVDPPAEGGGGSAPAPGAQAPTQPPGPGAQPPELPPDGPPKLGRTVELEPASGSVLVRLPGSGRYLPLDEASAVPTGSLVDARRGTVRLTSVRDTGGREQTGTFWGGAFQVRQRRSQRFLTELDLRGALRCTRARGSSILASAARSRSRRGLWGRDKGGRFRTRGRHGAATVRGTEWLTQDGCAATTFRVKRGAVVVRDFARRRNVLLRPGRSYRAQRR